MTQPTAAAPDPATPAPASVCPACLRGQVEIFHEQSAIPVNSCLLVESEADALGFPRGDLRLGFCPECGFISNSLFDSSRSTYSSEYEETQGFSPRFRAFARELAQRWIDRYDIHGKDVLEIGCGKGEFLALMCELGGNKGVGVDPSAIPERLETSAEVTLLPERFSAERHAPIPADVVVCRHTLEHIAPVHEFMAQVRAAIGDRTDTVVLFELPDVLRVLREVAFWDVYYEHCSYFSPGSLARLFRATGFEVLRLEMDYDDQYILLEARPVPLPAAGTPAGGPDPSGSSVPPLPLEDDVAEIAAAVKTFAAGFAEVTERERADLSAAKAAGGRVAVWGGGSKGVSYLTTLGGDSVAYAVDINPHKQGKYLAGTGHRVVGPQDLAAEPPDLVIAMNAVYTGEIQAELDRLALPAKLRAI